MTRWFGVVGFEQMMIKTAPGVWTEAPSERPYYGDVIRNARSMADGEPVNSDIRLSHTISIVADEHAYEHAHDIRYVEMAGTLWSVTEVEVKRPRLILKLGGVYNGPSV